MATAQALFSLLDVLRDVIDLAEEISKNAENTSRQTVKPQYVSAVAPLSFMYMGYDSPLFTESAWLCVEQWRCHTRSTSSTAIMSSLRIRYTLFDVLKL